MKTHISARKERPEDFLPILTFVSEDGQKEEVQVFQFNVFRLEPDETPKILFVSYEADTACSLDVEVEQLSHVRVHKTCDPGPDERVFLEVQQHRDGFREAILYIREDIAGLTTGPIQKDLFRSDEPMRFIGRIIAESRVCAFGNLSGYQTLLNSSDGFFALRSRIEKAREAIQTAVTPSEFDAVAGQLRDDLKELETRCKFWVDSTPEEILRRYGDG